MSGKFPLNIVDWPYQNQWKNTLFYISNIYIEAFYKFEKVGSHSAIMENTLKITVFHLLNKLILNIAKK